MIPEHETFWTLLTDGAHWQFELFLMFIFDIVIGLLIWPSIKKFILHHESDDKRIDTLEKEVAELKKKLG